MSRRLGEYVPLSVDYADDDAVIACTPYAELLFIRCLALARRLRSDGYLTDAQVVHRAAQRIGPPRRIRVLIAELVTQGLLERQDGGYVIRAWLKWNKSADELGRELARDRARKRSERADVPLESSGIPTGVQSESGSVQQESDGIPPSHAPARVGALGSAHARTVPNRTVPDRTEPQPAPAEVVTTSVEVIPAGIELPADPWLDGSTAATCDCGALLDLDGTCFACHSTTASRTEAAR